MTKIYLFGKSGKMGKALQTIAHQSGIEIVGGCNTTSADNCNDLQIDAIIDFSSADVLPQVLKLSALKNKPVLIASTGHSTAQLQQIKAHSQKLAVLQSANLSIGANSLLHLIKSATQILQNFDIEIVETHHNKKHDVPSGTSKAMLAAVAQSRVDVEPVQGRRQDDAIRHCRQVGMHSIRGGSHTGEHKIMYLGQSETLTITHTSQSREIFAQGAVLAVKWLVTQPPSLYNMQDVLNI